jgi:glycosyltransferase involved in cell wall biosynthesis
MERNVSVIISTYNNEDYLIECVNSIYKQNFDGNVEIIIGIDGCLKTLDLVKNNLNFFNNTSVFYFEENSGPYTLKNNLLELSSYEMVVFFDSDDIMLPNFLNVFFNHITDDNIFRFRFINFDNRSKKFETNEEYAWGVFGLSKTTFKNVGYFQNWRCSGDYEFIKRSKFFGVSSQDSLDLTFHRRVHDESLTKKFGTNFSSDLRKKYHEIVDSKIVSKVWKKPEFIKINYTKIN